MQWVAESATHITQTTIYIISYKYLNTLKHVEVCIY